MSESPTPTPTVPPAPPRSKWTIVAGAVALSAVVAVVALSLAGPPATRTPQDPIVTRSQPRPRPERVEGPSKDPIPLRPPYTYTERFARARGLMDQQKYDQAAEILAELSREFPDRRELSEAAMQAYFQLGDIANASDAARRLPASPLKAALFALTGDLQAALQSVEADHLYARVFTAGRDIRAAKTFASIPELDAFVRRIDDLEALEPDELGRALALAFHAEGLERIGAAGAAKRSRDRARELLPKMYFQEALSALDVPALASAARQAAQRGDWGPAQKLAEIAHRFSLAQVLEEMKDLDHELHAFDLLAAGNDADVLRLSGTAAFRKLAVKVLSSFRNLKFKSVLGTELKTESMDPTRPRYELLDGGAVRIQSPVPAYAQWTVPNAEWGFRVELGVKFDAPDSWGAVVLQAQPSVLLGVYPGRVEVRRDEKVLASGPAASTLDVHAILFKDHVLVFVQGEVIAVFAPGDLVLDSIVRVGVSRGEITVRKVEVME